MAASLRSTVGGVTGCRAHLAGRDHARRARAMSRGSWSRDSHRSHAWVVGIPRSLSFANDPQILLLRHHRSPSDSPLSSLPGRPALTVQTRTRVHGSNTGPLAAAQSRGRVPLPVSASRTGPILDPPAREALVCPHRPIG